MTRLPSERLAELIEHFADNTVARHQDVHSALTELRSLRAGGEAVGDVAAAFENIIERFERCARHSGSDDDTIAASTQRARAALRTLKEPSNG